MLINVYQDGFAIPISGLFIQQKALEIAISLRHVNFKASNSWLHIFKQIYGLNHRNIFHVHKSNYRARAEGWG